MSFEPPLLNKVARGRSADPKHKTESYPQTLEDLESRSLNMVPSTTTVAADTATS